MPIDNLIRPDNRLLGLGAADISTFGGQPNPAVAFANPAAPPATARAADPATDAAVSERLVVEPAGTATPDSVDTPNSPDTTAAPAAGYTPAPTNPDGARDDDDAAPAAAAGGSTPPALLTPTTAQAPDGTAVDDTSESVTDLFGGQTFAVAAPVVAGLAATAPVTTQLAEVEALLSGTMEALGDVDGQLGDVAGRLDSTIGSVGSAATGAAQDAAGSLAATPVHDIDPLIFSGTDPAGGIATLVGLVQTSELFTVGQGEVPDAPLAAGGSIVDDLIGDPGVLPDAAPLHDPLHDDDGIGLGL